VRWYAPRLDVIRFVAFALVFLGHNLAASAFVPSRIKDDAGPAEVFGVIIFFVLSAYLIGRLLLIERERTARISVRRYWARRTLRIWPLYFAIVLGTYAIGPVLRATGNTMFVPVTRALPGWLTFLANWTVPPATYITMFWTICVEEQVYFLFPLILLLALRPMQVVFLSMIVAGPISCFVVIRSGLSYPAVWNFTTSHLDSFGLGLLIALLDSRGHDAPHWWRPARRMVVSRPGIIVLATATAAYIIGGAAAGPTFYTGYPTVVTYLAATTLAAGWVIVASGSRPLGSPTSAALAWLGRRGYGLYAWHWPVLLIFVQLPLLARGGELTIGGFLASLAATVALAIVSYRFLEVPFLRRRLRFQVVPNRL
jgi:peptidoglycan/LPS O-acetylase OafA/YrhL